MAITFGNMIFLAANVPNYIKLIFILTMFVLQK